MTTANKPLKFLLILSVLAAAGFTAWYFYHTSEKNENRLTVYGNIDIRQVDLNFHDAETIEQMFVQEGDQVSKGQLLALQRLQRFQYAVANAEAKTEAQRQIVKRLANGSRPQDIRKAQADVKSAQAAVVFTEKELRRMQNLVKTTATSQQAADRAHSDYVAAKEKLQALTEQLALAVIGPRDEDIAEAKALLKANESALKLAQQSLQDGHLYAPADGIIQNRILEPGDMADNRTPVYTLALTDPVWARVYVPETELGQLQYGMPAQITTDSYPGKLYEGWVGYISPSAEFTPKTIETPELRTHLVYQVRVFACNPQNQLRLGMPVTVRIERDAKPGKAGCDYP